MVLSVTHAFKNVRAFEAVDCSESIYLQAGDVEIDLMHSLYGP
jgi:hypothetical protein